MPALLLTLAACSDSAAPEFRAGAPLPPPLIEVYAPRPGSQVPAGQALTVEYAVVRGKQGRYVKIRLDRQPPARVQGLQGRHLIETVRPGEHTLSLVERDAEGRETGGQAIVHFTAVAPADQ